MPLLTSSGCWERFRLSRKDGIWHRIGIIPAHHTNETRENPKTFWEVKRVEFSGGWERNEVTEKGVLIVDDERTFRGILRSFVESLGYRCADAESGRSALNILTKARFPIVISDIVMPEMDGLELLRIIKQRYSDVDVLIITGYQTNYSPMKIVQAGASDFLPKPFSLDQLGARLYKIEMEKTLKNQLYAKSITDDLTGLYNRAYFYQKLKRETERAKRQGHPLSIIMMDVDGFKKFNDRYGHLRGDALLRTVARVLRFSVREHVDSVFRYGGDEFVVVLPETDDKIALLVANRIKGNFKNTAPAGLSLSLGLAEFGENSDAETLVNLADKRMYEEKIRSKGLWDTQLEIGIEKDDYYIECLSCGSRVHWTSSVCENCLADPLKRTDLERSQEIARAFLRKMDQSVEDRRRAPRIKIRKSIVGDSLEATIQNISWGGVQIRTEASLSVGNILKVPLSVEKDEAKFSGAVVYVQSLTDGGSLVGIRFSEISGEDSKLLKRFLEHYSP